MTYNKDGIFPEGIDLIEFPAYSPWLPPAQRLWPLTNEVVANCSPVFWDELEELLVYRCLQADETARFNHRINLLLLVTDNPGQLNRSDCAIAKKSLFPQPQGVSECQQQIFKSLRVLFTRPDSARSRQSTQFILGNRGLQTADLTGAGNWMNRVWQPRAAGTHASNWSLKPLAGLIITNHSDLISDLTGTTTEPDSPGI